MTTFLWILLSGILMSAIALVGSVTLVLRESTLQRILLPLVSFAAGSLIGGALTLEIYRLTASFPADERFGLVSQIRRAATSIPSNIAEGSRRSHTRDYGRFLNIAESSGAELSYLIILSRDLGFVDQQRAR